MFGTRMILLLLPLFIGAAATRGHAGPFDQLKNLKIEPQALFRANQNQTVFQFANFRLESGGSGRSLVWSVDLKTGQAIPAGTYLVTSAFHDSRGTVLFTGEEIALPTAEPGKTFHLTRSFENPGDVSDMTLQVYNRLAERSEATQSYPLSVPFASGADGAGAPARPDVPRAVAEARASADAAPAYAFVPGNIVPGKSSATFQLQNRGSILLRLTGISAVAKHLAGADQAVTVNCQAVEIPPGQSLSCTFYYEADCPAVAGIDFSIGLNGSSYRQTLPLDAPIRIVYGEPVVSLARKKHGDWGHYDHGYGVAEVSIPGSYVKPGGAVTMKALVSLDSEMFPVVFSGRQEEGGLYGIVQVVGTRYQATPDRFCFNLTEVTTCDDIRCGGVGILLYRNRHNQSPYVQGSGGNYFLNQKLCK